jgi:hypothetical protein
MCRTCAAITGGVFMARKVGQIIRRGGRTWLVRVYNGRDVETKKRRYLNQTVLDQIHSTISRLQ